MLSHQRNGLCNLFAMEVAGRAAGGVQVGLAGFAVRRVVRGSWSKTSPRATTVVDGVVGVVRVG